MTIETAVPEPTTPGRAGGQGFGGQGFGGQGFGGQGFGGQLDYAHQKTSQLPTKKRSDFEQKRGWIEFPKKGTKNPKRYAYRRRWLPDGAGGWKKSKPVRIMSIEPMSEKEYETYKQQQRDIKKLRNNH